MLQSRTACRNRAARSMKHSPGRPLAGTNSGKRRHNSEPGRAACLLFDFAATALFFPSFFCVFRLGSATRLTCEPLYGRSVCLACYNREEAVSPSGEMWCWAMKMPRLAASWYDVSSQ